MISLPSDVNYRSIADWVELKVILSQKPLSKSEVFRTVQSENEDISESFINDVIFEIERRVELYGESPIDCVDDIISPKIELKDCPCYVLCLLFSIYGVESDDGNGTKLFEKITKEAANNYLNGESILFAFSENQSFDDKLENASIELNERLSNRYPAPTVKDGGVDVIAWKPFGDKRDCQIVLLLDSAAGSNWMTKKPISMKAWREYILWGVYPIPGIATPQVIELENWRKANDSYNFILDRVRIYRYIINQDFEDTTLNQDAINWCDGKIAKHEVC